MRNLVESLTLVIMATLAFLLIASSLVLMLYVVGLIP
jgi:hypothetical protein